MPPLPPLALDTANFAAIREQGQAYVDKTAYIQALLEERTRYAFLARPRRFGKSLLVSTLARLFERTNDDLFRGLDIEKSGFLAQASRVPALVLNMARVGGETPQEVRSELSRLVRRQSQRFDFEPSETIPPWSALDDLCDHLQHQHGQFAILVDEYDAPLTDMLANPLFSPQDQQQVQCYLRNFYRALENRNDAIRLVFITGIVQIAGAGLFSALNNLRDLSADPDYGAMCGFTETEIDRFLSRHIDQAARNYACSPASMRETLRQHYNGYCFAATSEWVYNPISYLTALSRLTRPKYAQAIRATEFPRPWIDTGPPWFLFRLMQEQGQTMKDIDYHAADVRASFDLQRPTLNALMYQTGFLTLRQENGKTVLDYPNLEVESSLHEGLFFAYLGKPVAKDSRERALVLSMTEALQRGDCGQSIADFDRILDRMPYALLQTESHFQLVLHTICSMIRGVLRVDSEAPVRRGRADSVVETRDAVYVFELKLNRKLQDATDQILARGYRDKYAAEGKRVMGVGLNFIQRSNEEERWAASASNYEWELVPLTETVLDGPERPGRDDRKAKAKALSTPSGQLSG